MKELTELIPTSAGEAANAVERFVQDYGFAHVELRLGLHPVVEDDEMFVHGFAAAGGEPTLQARQETSATFVIS
jgi:hypothetical protein